MSRENDEIRTPRELAHMCNKGFRNGHPVGLVKVKAKRDYMTASEYAEALYGKPVMKIVFKDGVEVEEFDVLSD